MAKREFRAGNRARITEDPFKHFRVVGCNKLNLRSLPSKDSRVVMVLNKGDIVESVEATGLDWKRVSYTDNGEAAVGYCMAEFLEEVTDGSDNSTEY